MLSDYSPLFHPVWSKTEVIRVIFFQLVPVIEHHTGEFSQSHGDYHSYRNFFPRSYDQIMLTLHYGGWSGTKRIILCEKWPKGLSSTQKKLMNQWMYQRRSRFKWEKEKRTDASGMNLGRNGCRKQGLWDELGAVRKSVRKCSKLNFLTMWLSKTQKIK